MFLHKLDILNRNLNGLFQKFKPVVTKLCAVTKLGDLTVRYRHDGYRYGTSLSLFAHRWTVDVLRGSYAFKRLKCALCFHALRLSKNILQVRQRLIKKLAKVVQFLRMSRLSDSHFELFFKLWFYDLSVCSIKGLMLDAWIWFPR